MCSYVILVCRICDGGGGFLLWGVACRKALCGIWQSYTLAQGGLGLLNNEIVATHTFV